MQQPDQMPRSNFSIAALRDASSAEDARVTHPESMPLISYLIRCAILVLSLQRR